MPRLVGEQCGLLCIHEHRFVLKPEMQLVQHARMCVYAIVFYVVFDMALNLFCQQPSLVSAYLMCLISLLHTIIVCTVSVLLVLQVLTCV